MNLFKSALILGFVVLLSACNQDKIQQLESENMQLKEQASSKDSSIQKMLSSFNEIQENLSEIKKREGIIRIGTADINGTSKDIGASINEDVELISNLMRKNETLVKQLNSELSKSKLQSEEFRKLIAGLNQSVRNKNTEIANLNKELQSKKIKIGQLYYTLDSLTFLYEVSEAELEQKINQLNEGYYAMGTYKELKEKNVLDKEGGVLGLGKTKELKNNFNEEYFSKVDIQEQRSFLIYAKKAELVTNHPEDSYEFRGEGGKVDSLVITNVEEFWKASKYMVIVVN